MISVAMCCNFCRRFDGGGVRSYLFERGEDASVFAFDFRNVSFAPSYICVNNIYGCTVGAIHESPVLHNTLLHTKLWKAVENLGG